MRGCSGSWRAHRQFVRLERAAGSPNRRAVPRIRRCPRSRHGSAWFAWSGLRELGVFRSAHFERPKQLSSCQLMAYESSETEHTFFGLKVEIDPRGLCNRGRLRFEGGIVKFEFCLDSQDHLFRIAPNGIGNDRFAISNYRVLASDSYTQSSAQPTLLLKPSTPTVTEYPNTCHETKTTIRTRLGLCNNAHSAVLAGL